MTGDNKDSTLRARLLGRNLIQWLDQENLSRAEAARRIGLSPHGMTRLLYGKSRSVPDVAGILALCRIIGDDRRKALEVAADPHLRTWFEMTDRGLPSRWNVVDYAEQAAQHVTEYHQLVVPELVQLPSYAHALLRATPTVRPELIDTQIQHLQRRQSVLHRDPRPSFRFIIHERALRPRRAEWALMAEQVQHLARVADLPNVEVLVVPDDAGLAAAYLPFTLFRFDKNPPVVCLSTLNCVVVLEEPDSVAGYQNAVSNLRGVAMSGERSHAWLRTLGAQLAGPTESADQS